MAAFQKFAYYNEILTDPCEILLGLILLWPLCCITSAIDERFSVSYIFVSTDFKINGLSKS